MDITTYFEEIRKYPPLTRNEEKEVMRAAKAGNARKLDLLMKSNLRFVVSVAKKYQKQGLPLEDLIAEGNFGLFKAFEKFDINSNYKFITYAVWWIKQSILSAIYDHSRIVRLPVNKITSITKANKIKAELEQSTGEELSMSHIINNTNPELYDDYLHSYNTVYLEDPLNDDEHDLNEIIYDLESPPEPPKNELLDDLEIALMDFPDREREILLMYFGLGCDRTFTLQEIGDIQGLTRERIRQLKIIAIEKLKQPNIKKLLITYL